MFAGDTVQLDAQGTRDPDGDAILMTFITPPDGRTRRATEVAWTFATPGRIKVAVEALDSHGARARKDHEILVVPRPVNP